MKDIGLVLSSPVYNAPNDMGVNKNSQYMWSSYLKRVGTVIIHLVGQLPLFFKD